MRDGCVARCENTAEHYVEIITIILIYNFAVGLTFARQPTTENMDFGVRPVSLLSTTIISTATIFLNYFG